MHVFDVRASSSPPRVPNFVSFAAPIADIAHGEKLHTQSSITQSLTHPAHLMPWEPKLSLWKIINQSRGAAQILYTAIRHQNSNFTKIALTVKLKDHILQRSNHRVHCSTYSYQVTLISDKSFSVIAVVIN